MLVEFKNKEVLEAQTANLPVIKNTGKPFELDDATANAYIEEGFLSAVGGETQAEAVETVESLAKKSRDDLEGLAKSVGLDGDSYTNKKELAAAILTAKGE